MTSRTVAMLSCGVAVISWVFVLTRPGPVLAPATAAPLSTGTYPNPGMATTTSHLTECVRAGGSWDEFEGRNLCLPPKETASPPSPSENCRASGGAWAHNLQSPDEGVCIRYFDGGS